MLSLINPPVDKALIGFLVADDSAVNLADLANPASGSIIEQDQPGAVHPPSYHNGPDGESQAASVAVEAVDTAQELPEGAVVNENGRVTFLDPAEEVKQFHSSKPFSAKRVFLKREKPEHREMLYLKLQGYTHKEIAEIMEVTPMSISNVMRQPWAQQFLAEEIGKTGRDSIEVVLRGEALNCVQKLIELRDDPNANKEIQRKSANDLLDRVYGKPNQPITHSTKAADQMSDEELAKIAQQGKSN